MKPISDAGHIEMNWVNPTPRRGWDTPGTSACEQVVTVHSFFHGLPMNKWRGAVSPPQIGRSCLEKYLENSVDAIHPSTKTMGCFSSFSSILLASWLCDLKKKNPFRLLLLQWDSSLALGELPGESVHPHHENRTSIGTPAWESCLLGSSFFVTFRRFAKDVIFYAHAWQSRDKFGKPALENQQEQNY